MGRLPRRTSAHIFSSPPQDLGVIPEDRTDPSRVPLFRDMGRLPRRTSAHIPSGPLQERDIFPEDRAQPGPRITAAPRSTQDETHPPEHYHIAEIMISLRSSRPTRPARSCPRPINDEDLQGNFPFRTETSLPPRRRRRVQEEPPVCPVNNGAQGTLPIPGTSTAGSVRAHVDQASENDRYRKIYQRRGRVSHPYAATLRGIVLPRAARIPSARPCQGQGDSLQHAQTQGAFLLGRGKSEDPPASDNMQRGPSKTLVEDDNHGLMGRENTHECGEDFPRSAAGGVSSPTEVVYDIRDISFNRELSVILTEMRNLKLDTPPPAVAEGVLLGYNLEQWCDYHQCHGHHTDNCLRLRHDVERLARRGKLPQFIPDLKRPSTEAQTHPLPEGKGKEKIEYAPCPPDTLLPPRPVKHIGVISGGFASGGIVSNQRDVYATQVGEPAMTGNRPATRSQEAITFSDADMEHVAFPHDDALVVTLMTHGYGLRRILIDGGSSVDILFKDAFLALGFQLRDLKPADVPLTGFSGATTRSLGSITLPVTFGSGAASVRTFITFLVVDAPAIYNAIIGRTTLHSLQIIPSTVHQKMKFWTPNGVGEVRGDQAASRSCYVNALRRGSTATTASSTAISGLPEL